MATLRGCQRKQALLAVMKALLVLQVIVLLPLFVFCWYMYKWEREDLVPIRCVLEWSSCYTVRCLQLLLRAWYQGLGGGCIPALLAE